MTTDDLIEDIKANRCILFTGPLMSTFEDENGQWVSHTELYCRYLQSELQKSHVAFDNNAISNPYYLATRYFSAQENALSNDKKFIEDLYKKDSSLYKDLAIIPFNTIINFGFDNYMYKAVKDAGYEAEFRYYNYNGPEIPHMNADKDIQLVYNIFGWIEKPESRVLTEKNQLEFLRKINSSPKLPDDLLSRIKEGKDGPKSYIFLEFNFEEWPFRFLLNTLELPKASRTITLNASQTNVAVMTHDFYRDTFGFDFRQQSSKEFIKELIAKYTGSVAKHQYGFISYVEQEENVVRSFREFADITLELMRGISIWDKSQAAAGDITPAETAEHLKQATVYFPFMSSKSIVDKGFRQEVNEMISRKDVLIFPVIVKDCLWTNVFPQLADRASVVLPAKDDVLNNSFKTAAEEDYKKMVRTINSKIR